MTDRYYPSLDTGGLLAVRAAIQQMQDDPLWLDRDECPYDQHVREHLRMLSMSTRAETDVPEAISLDDDKRIASLEVESIKLFNRLQAFSLTMPESATTAEKMAYFRTATSLLERITALTERASGLREISLFQRGVIDMFEEVLTPEQRTTTLEKLKELAAV